MGEKRSETFVGLFVLVGLLALGGLIVTFGKFGDVFRDEYSLTVEFRDASGLIKGSDVRMGGAKVGTVTSQPRLTEDSRVMVTLKIDESVMLAKGAKFQIQSVSLLGDKMVVVVPPDEGGGEFYADGDFVMGAESGGLDKLQHDAGELADSAKDFARDAKVSMKKLNEALDEIKVVAGKLSVTMDRVNTGVLGDETVAGLKKSIANFEMTSEHFLEVSRELKPVLGEVREMVGTAKRAAESADRTFVSAEAEIRKLEPALRDVPKTLANVRQAAEKASVFMDRATGTLAKIEKGDGLLGTLVYDKGTKSDVKVFLSNLKRYGILGYKDSSTYDERDPKGDRYRGNRR